MADGWDILWTLAIAGMLAAAALVLHGIAVAILRRIAARTHTDTDGMLLDCVQQPLRWIMAAGFVLGTDNFAAADPQAAAAIVEIARTAMPLLIGWLGIGLIRFVKRWVYARSDIAAEDNLAARRRRTRADILSRIAMVAVALVSVGLLLLRIPEVREIGMALVASAGIAGLAFGVAAQPLLKNLVAGMQLAFTEPIRIDDVLVYRGEWGRVERISLTYVVLRIWDERRLVIPVAKLMEEPIENWTHRTAEVLGAVHFHLDHAADVAALRAFALQAVRSHPLWDGRTASVQVTGMTADAMEVRVLVSARGGSQLFDLRCDIRESVAAHIARTMPGALNRRRLTLEPERVAERMRA